MGSWINVTKVIPYQPHRAAAKNTGIVQLRNVSVISCMNYIKPVSVSLASQTAFFRHHKEKRKKAVWLARLR